MPMGARGEWYKIDSRTRGQSTVLVDDAVLLAIRGEECDLERVECALEHVSAVGKPK